MSRLTHINQSGEASMVDVSDKTTSSRVAVAATTVRMKRETLDLVFEGAISKGDVLSVARIAGIQAAKRTSELIPLCHPLPLSLINITFERVDDNTLQVKALCKVTSRTGVEMEALVGATIASLTIYDMCKGVEKGISLSEVRLISKTGGKSGDWHAENQKT